VRKIDELRWRPVVGLVVPTWFINMATGHSVFMEKKPTPVPEPPERRPERPTPRPEEGPPDRAYETEPVSPFSTDVPVPTDPIDNSPALRAACS
jgi:hypothetical protein